MNQGIILLCLTAGFLGFIHTVLGPDHYLPFIVISKARGWSIAKTMVITILCGIGHVLGSIVLGILGILAGIALNHLEFFEEIRGNIAAYLLIGFGFVYCVWGIIKAVKNKPHRHFHIHENTSEHSHEHIHHNEHTHVHTQNKKNITPWILFIIFVFGPCEPLIPLLIFPAAKESIFGVILVAGVFSIITIATMSAITLISVFGLSFVKFSRLERYTHALAGGAILMSGMAIQFLGL